MKTRIQQVTAFFLVIAGGGLFGLSCFYHDQAGSICATMFFCSGFIANILIDGQRLERKPEEAAK